MSYFTLILYPAGRKMTLMNCSSAPLWPPLNPEEQNKVLSFMEIIPEGL